MVTVSDLAAMGARPDYALVSIAAPAGTDIERLGAGLAAASAEAAAWWWAVTCPSRRSWWCRSPCPAGSGPAGRPPLLRSGARPGRPPLRHRPLGGSAAGLRLLRPGSGSPAPRSARPTADWLRAHRRPVARLGEGEVARRAGATAAIDISDGLVADLGHLAGPPGSAIALDAVPVADRGHRGGGPGRG